MRLFADAGISVRRGIMAAHLEPAYADAKPSLPVTQMLTRRSLIVPLFHEMTQAQQEHVVSVVTSALTNSTSAMSAP
jgi:perosamine synthetase